MNEEMKEFAKDFVFSLMKQWRPEWEINNPHYAGRNANSPFTDNMKKKIELMTEDNRSEIQRSFEYEFPNANVHDNRFSDVCEKYRYNFVSACRRNEAVNVEEVFLLFLKLAKFAGLAVCFKVQSAPYVVVETVCRVLEGLRDYELLPETFWVDMDRYCCL